ncbi:hypothetical protein E4P29_05400 [Rhodococcus sp. 1R11]|uniref:hypothetical protein n=1 Tax=Rhodococcus sp. 1R11 TaxID=2559614 RepID=UPI001102EAD3|nr:hypothetical protein [Rhodococcus sp. 1R11]TFI45152.1 hypothetical protein E4P29_05400 [Rhodococcus sp. 1R11]
MLALVELLVYCMNSRTNGFVKEKKLRSATLHPEPLDAVGLLVEHGLLKVVPGGWQVDWSEQLTADEIAKNERRGADWARHRRGNHRECAHYPGWSCHKDGELAKWQKEQTVHVYAPVDVHADGHVLTESNGTEQNEESSESKEDSRSSLPSLPAGGSLLRAPAPGSGSDDEQVRRAAAMERAAAAPPGTVPTREVDLDPMMFHIDVKEDAFVIKPEWMGETALQLSGEMKWGGRYLTDTGGLKFTEDEVPVVTPSQRNPFHAQVLQQIAITSLGEQFGIPTYWHSESVRIPAIGRQETDAALQQALSQVEAWLEHADSDPLEAAKRAGTHQSVIDLPMDTKKP